MKEETLKKANDLANKLVECKNNLQKIGYTQNANVVIRESYLSFSGIEDSVIIPESLFRIVGKLIESEYIHQIDKLQKELDEL